MNGKIIRTGTTLAITLPQEALEALGLGEGAEVQVQVQPERHQVTLTPPGTPASTVDETFARQLAEFIEQYRPALQALAD